MEVFMPHQAGLVVLSFLGTALLLGVLGLAFLWTLAAGKRALALKVLATGAVVAGLYVGTLLGFSWSSEEQTLTAGQQKYFCEIDCHVAYSVADVTTTKTLGEGAVRTTAGGMFHVVTVRTWFDEDTISPRRAKDLPLRPSPRQVYAYDQQGRRYTTSLEGQKALVGSTVPLTHPLRPGESYTTQLVFDLPADAVHPRLLIGDAFPLSALLIGHENSPGHKKVYFAIEPHAHISSVR
jgi:hypothetical protein